MQESPSLMRRGTGPVSGEYAQLFHDTKAMGKDKGWSEQKIAETLKNPEKAKKQVEMVSKSFKSYFLICSLFC